MRLTTDEVPRYKDKLVRYINASYFLFVYKQTKFALNTTSKKKRARILGKRRVCVIFQAEDDIRDVERSRVLGDVYKKQVY